MENNSPATKIEAQQHRIFYFFIALYEKIYASKFPEAGETSCTWKTEFFLCLEWLKRLNLRRKLKETNTRLWTNAEEIVIFPWVFSR